MCGVYSRWGVKERPSEKEPFELRSKRAGGGRRGGGGAGSLGRSQRMTGKHLACWESKKRQVMAGAS